MENTDGSHSVDYIDCKHWFEYQLKERWNFLYEDEQAIFRKTISAIDELLSLRVNLESLDIASCKRCQCERSGEGYGDDVPPKDGEDDICDSCAIKKRLLDSVKLNGKENA